MQPGTIPAAVLRIARRLAPIVTSVVIEHLIF